jgi:hypothetical protein
LDYIDIEEIQEMCDKQWNSCKESISSYSFICFNINVVCIISFLHKSNNIVFRTNTIKFFVNVKYILY